MQAVERIRLLLLCRNRRPVLDSYRFGLSQSLLGATIFVKTL